MTQPINWQIDEKIAIVTLDAPDAKVNILTEDFIEALEDVVSRLAEVASLEGVIVTSGKPSGFIAGADIEAIEDVTDPDEGMRLAQKGQAVFQKWANLGLPVIAAIHGHCLGGGLEFALACTHRILSVDARLGLPEVKLGILPGFGGTQRLPRLIGIEKALDLLLKGRTLRAEKACDLGLADMVVRREELSSSAMQFALDTTAQPRRRPQRTLRQWLLEGNPVGRALLFTQAKKSILHQTKGHYPAPLTILETVRATCKIPLQQGLQVEAEALGELIVSSVSKNLVHVYHLSQRCKQKFPSVPEPGIRKVAVLGAGVMGAGIAWLLADHDKVVLLCDIDEAALEHGMAHARELYRKKSHKSDPQSVKETLPSNLQGTTSYKDFSGVDLVIEAVVERMEVKQKVLRETEGHITDQAMFASNTSALSISEMQSVAERPANVAGLHFFNPVERMPLVEIIRGKLTDDASLVILHGLALELGKTPIIVKDRPGFLVNRLLGFYLNEACLLAEEGIDWRSIDRRALDFGMPMGPFRLIDEIGIDIAQEVGTTLSNSFDYFKPSTLLQTLLVHGFKGRKSGQGFYAYQDKEDEHPNPEIRQHLPATADDATADDWLRLLRVMVAEAWRCLDEQVIASPEDIDTGMIFGTGFPPFLGGLCRWADNQTDEALYDYVKSGLNYLSEQRFLIADVHRGQKFYSADGWD